MHILFLADASSPHSYRWIKYFSKIKGVRVTWCSFSENTMPKLDNVEVKILDKSNPIKFIKSMSAKKINNSFKGYILPSEKSIDIDNYDDWKFAEIIYKGLNKKNLRF